MVALEKLYLKIAENNVKSYKLAEKCGFLKEGILKNDHRTTDGTPLDIYYYGLTYGQYFQQRI